jgi:hypothetical protein
VEGSGRSAEIAVVHDNDGFLARLTGVIDRTTSTTFSRVPTVSIDASSAASCKLSTEALTSGPAVVELPSSGTAVAVGSLVSDHSDDEINQYLATSPTASAGSSFEQRLHVGHQPRPTRADHCDRDAVRIEELVHDRQLALLAKMFDVERDH